MQETDVGEVVVYNVKDKDIPIVHRIVRKFGTGPHAKLLTKGDNNAADDTELCEWLCDGRGPPQEKEADSSSQMPKGRTTSRGKTLSAASLDTYHLSDMSRSCCRNTRG